MLPGIDLRCRCVLFVINRQVSPDAVGINKCYRLKDSISNLKHLKFHSLRKHLGQYKNQQWRKCATETSSELVENKSSLNKNKKTRLFIVPPLKSNRIKEITSVAGICFNSHISWIKIAIPTLTVMEWNAKVLPSEFACTKDESSILKWAYDLKHGLPPADLYVMETFSIKGKKFIDKVNFLHLSSMLAVLLNGLNTDSNCLERVVFQKQFVLNNLHSLLVKSERVTTKEKVEDIIYKSVQQNKDSDPIDQSDIYSSVKIHMKYLEFFKDSDLSKKEDLSLVFLLTLSFIDVNIFQNKKSIDKILERKSLRLKLDTEKSEGD